LPASNRSESTLTVKRHFEVLIADGYEVGGMLYWSYQKTDNAATAPSVAAANLPNTDVRWVIRPGA
jgi:hypothetical protein